MFWIFPGEGVTSPIVVYSLEVPPGFPPLQAKHEAAPLGKPIVVQVQQGVNAVNYPYAPLGACYQAQGLIAPDAAPPCQSEVLGFTAAPSTQPSVSFTCPASKTFSLQWAPFARSDAAAWTSFWCSTRRSRCFSRSRRQRNAS